MKKKELTNLGLQTKEQRDAAAQVIELLRAEGLDKGEIRTEIQNIISKPAEYLEILPGSLLAKCLVSTQRDSLSSYTAVPFVSWGESLIEEETLEQMDIACRLPVAVTAALMPDAHLGYGLPVGGVLATDNSVIPYAVGVDIGCRVKITVTDIPMVQLNKNIHKFERALDENTSFGIGARFSNPKDHPIMDRDWSLVPLIKNSKDLAWGQLGTSGSGNHFVEFGEFELPTDSHGLEAGTYLALVSHSGSRGPGSKVAGHYTKLAASIHPNLPAKLKHLAWLDLDTAEGQEYWQAMTLMGDYASANHDIIHKDVLKAVGAKALFSVENHHNFAWKEELDGKQVITHRKGATPAHKGVLGYIPGTMVDSGYLVEGTGKKEALNSCSHGAGRLMSRKRARNTTTRNALKSSLKKNKVRLISSGLDESPHAYKAIESVMSAQKDLVKVIGQFRPRIVKMAPEGEKPED